jgi:Trk K+ transport system NAD-binding subunit
MVAERMNELGVRVVQPQLATALAIEGALHFPATFDMLVNQTDNVTVREAVLSNRQLNAWPLRRLRLPGGALVLGLRRDGEVLVPRGDTVVYLGDVLMLVGEPEGLHRAMLWLSPSGSGEQPHPQVSVSP